MSEKKIKPKWRQLVRERAGNSCEYCLAISGFSFHPFPIDHIIPLSHGGKHLPENFAFSCQHCNNCKYNKTESADPLTEEMVSLFNPRNQKWAEHFEWNGDFTIVVGITQVGRATVACLKMNRREAVNLRMALQAFGVHPPKVG